jgi:hypothetical protein
MSEIVKRSDWYVPAAPDTLTRTTVKHRIILASAPEIEAFIRENDSKLKTKE